MHKNMPLVRHYNNMLEMTTFNAVTSQASVDPSLREHLRRQRQMMDYCIKKTQEKIRSRSVKRASRSIYLRSQSSDV